MTERLMERYKWKIIRLSEDKPTMLALSQYSDGGWELPQKILLPKHLEINQDIVLKASLQFALRASYQLLCSDGTLDLRS